MVVGPAVNTLVVFVLLLYLSSQNFPSDFAVLFLRYNSYLKLNLLCNDKMDNNL